MGIAITTANPNVGSDNDVWGAENNALWSEVKAKLAAMDHTSVGLSNVPNTDATARANHTGTQTASTISDLVEVIQDLVAAMVVAGAGISVTYDDTAGTLTLASATNPSPVEIFWDGTGSCPARSTATASTTPPISGGQLVEWNTPTVSTPPTAGGLYALEGDKWFYGS